MTGRVKVPDWSLCLLPEASGEQSVEVTGRISMINVSSNEIHGVNQDKVSMKGMMYLKEWLLILTIKGAAKDSP